MFRTVILAIVALSATYAHAQGTNPPAAKSTTTATAPAAVETITVPVAEYTELQRKANQVPALVEQIRTLRKRLMVAEASLDKLSGDIVAFQDQQATQRAAAQAARPAAPKAGETPK
jgi:hypothetical protein